MRPSIAARNAGARSVTTSTALFEIGDPEGGADLVDMMLAGALLR